VIPRNIACFMVCVSFGVSSLLGGASAADQVPYKEWINIAGATYGNDYSGRAFGLDVVSDLKIEIVRSGQRDRALEVAREWLAQHVRKDSKMLGYQLRIRDHGHFWTVAFVPNDDVVSDGILEIDIDKTTLSITSASLAQ
jgi:hypothetical protein